MWLICMCHWTIILIKINYLYLITSIYIFLWKHFHASEYSPSFIPVSMRYLNNFVSSGKYLMGVVADRILKFLFLSYLINNAAFQSTIWLPLRSYPMFLLTLNLSGKKTSKFETIFLIWSNIDQSYSISVLW